MLNFLVPVQTGILLVKLGQVSVNLFVFWFMESHRGSCVLGWLVVSFLTRICWWPVYPPFSSNRCYLCWEPLPTLFLND